MAQATTTQAPLSHRRKKRPPQPPLLRRRPNPRLQYKRARKSKLPRQLQLLSRLSRQPPRLLKTLQRPRQQIQRKQKHRAQHRVKNRRPRCQAQLRRKQRRWILSAQRPHKVIRNHRQVLSLLYQQHHLLHHPRVAAAAAAPSLTPAHTQASLLESSVRNLPFPPKVAHMLIFLSCSRSSCSDIHWLHPL